MVETQDANYQNNLDLFSCKKLKKLQNINNSNIIQIKFKNKYGGRARC